jgi:uncharacterized protein YndB with AHSA1/START domain
MAAKAKGRAEPMKPNPTSMERTSDREIVITHTFRAPADLVFDAWTKPEHVKRWWAPESRDVTLVQCDADVRPGGKYRYVLARGSSERFAFSGKYLEIARPTRVVYTQSFEPMPGEAVVTVSFEERDGSTTLVAHELYPSKEALDGALKSGMEDGMRETFDQLDELVASLSG